LVRRPNAGPTEDRANHEGSHQDGQQRGKTVIVLEKAEEGKTLDEGSKRISIRKCLGRRVAGFREREKSQARDLGKNGREVVGASRQSLEHDMTPERRG